MSIFSEYTPRPYRLKAVRIDDLKTATAVTQELAPGADIIKDGNRFFCVVVRVSGRFDRVKIYRGQWLVMRPGDRGSVVALDNEEFHRRYQPC